MDLRLRRRAARRHGCRPRGRRGDPRSFRQPTWARAPPMGVQWLWLPLQRLAQRCHTTRGPAACRWEPRRPPGGGLGRTGGGPCGCQTHCRSHPWPRCHRSGPWRRRGRSGSPGGWSGSRGRPPLPPRRRGVGPRPRTGRRSIRWLGPGGATRAAAERRRTGWSRRRGGRPGQARSPLVGLRASPEGGPG